jgi:response regulator RpfG family c-di-GMP phosphodiesterase
MDNRVLLVDDEPNLLQALRRSLYGKFQIATAVGGSDALTQLRDNGPFAVLVSDMQMPDVNGLDVLREARQLAPETVRIMLTGNVDQQTAVDAVNDGAIFRFVNKPCPAEKLAVVLDSALRQYELVTAEKVLLSRTLTSSISLVNEVLAIASPKAFGRGGRMRTMAKRVAEALELPDVWQFEVAAMLSQIGCISFIGQDSNQESGPRSQIEMNKQAQLGSKIVGRIPRLESIASMIGGQYAKSFEADVPEHVRIGAKLLRMLTDYDILVESMSSVQAVRRMAVRRMSEDCGPYEPALFEALEDVVLKNIEIREVKVSELTVKMLLDKDVYTAGGELLIRSGQELTETLIHRLQTFSRNGVGVREPLLVQVDASLQPVS